MRMSILEGEIRYDWSKETFSMSTNVDHIIIRFIQRPFTHPEATPYDRYQDIDVTLQRL